MCLCLSFSSALSQGRFLALVSDPHPCFSLLICTVLLGANGHTAPPSSTRKVWSHKTTGPQGECEEVLLVFIFSLLL